MNNLAKEFICEMIGTAILMLLGISGCACSKLSHSPTNIQCGFSYAFGVVIASVFAGPISGAHINPAITLAFSVIGKFEWRKIPLYFAAQYIGSFIGSFLAWTIYFESIHGFEVAENLTVASKETASIFITLPSDHITIWPAVWDQVVSTALLVFANLFIGDETLSKSPKLLQTLTSGLVVLTFIIGFNYNCGAILNPARDLMPRILLWLIGDYKDVFKPLNYNFWWAVGIIGPHLGAVIGAILYYYIAKMRLSYAQEEDLLKFSSQTNPSTSVIQGKSILPYNPSPIENLDVPYQIRRAKITNGTKNHNINQSLTNNRNVLAKDF